MRLHLRWPVAAGCVILASPVAWKAASVWQNSNGAASPASCVSVAFRLCVDDARSWVARSRLLGAGDFQRTQDELLMSLVHANQHTLYGRDHGFAGIQSPDEFRAKTPVVTYPYLAVGGALVLVCAGLMLFSVRDLMCSPTWTKSGPAPGRICSVLACQNTFSRALASATCCP